MVVTQRSAQHGGTGELSDRLGRTGAFVKGNVKSSIDTAGLNLRQLQQTARRTLVKNVGAFLFFAMICTYIVLVRFF
jgi:hypothetical protein